jgi:hypothetical protein
MVMLNFAQDDYGPSNVLRYTDKGSEGLNTITDKYFIFSKNMPRIFPLPLKLNQLLLRSSATYRFLNIHVYNILSRIYPLLYPPEIYKVMGAVEAEEFNRQSIDMLYSLSLEHDFSIVVVSFPVLLNDNSVNDKWIITYPKKYNATIIDLYPLLRNKDIDLESIRISRNDFAHPNREGHRIIGDILYEELKETI